MDPLTSEQRHKAMSHVKSKDTSIEIKLRKALWHKGYRYRKNYKALPGTPDIAITKYHIAIFCDSEFFHGRDWDSVLSAKVRRGNNPEFWEKKIVRNIERDRETNKRLNALGWKVIRFWGKEINASLDSCIEIVEDAIFQSKIETWINAHPDPYVTEDETETGDINPLK